MSEKLSAWMDGELSADEADFAPDVAETALSQTWWALGDALRAQSAKTAASAAPLSADFHAKFMARLADEPTVLAPQGRKTLPWAHWTLAASVAAVVLSVGLSVNYFSTPTPELAATPFDARGVNVAGAASAKDWESERAYLLAHDNYGYVDQLADVPVGARRDLTQTSSRASN